jgi:hypothetical protein
MNALLFNTPNDPTSLAEFAAIHQADHFDITLGLFRLLQVTAEVPPIDPIPVEFQLEMLTWLMNHQFIHNQANGYLGLAGFDLTSVDFANREQLLIWTRYNALEHYNMSQALARLQSQQQQQQAT